MCLSLRRKGVECELECRVCGSFDESQMHLFFYLELEVEVWKELCPILLSYVHDHNCVLRDEIILYADENNLLTLVGYALWILWKNRNMACFELYSSLPMQLLGMLNILLLSL